MELSEVKQVAASSVSGDNMVGHVLTAATLGGGLSSIFVWIIQTFAHVDPPAAVAQGITAISMVIASIIMRKIVT